MKINEIFKSIQGEGRYAGEPALFIRLSGCNKKCKWCDTQYHTKYKNYDTSELVDIIDNSDTKIVVWTGGEPTLQFLEISEVIYNTMLKSHHLETNGSIPINYHLFDYVCISPKSSKDIEHIYNERIKIGHLMYDVKVVTDLKMNKKLIPYATMLMPLTTYNKKEDLKIKKDVWNYCVDNNIRFSLRQHVEVWNKKRRT